MFSYRFLRRDTFSLSWSSQGMRRILIADDDPDTFIILDIFFKSLFPGVQITAATNGAMALELCSLQNFDLICTDFNMPVLNGMDFIRTLRQNPGLNRTIQVIMISGNIAAFKAEALTFTDVYVLEKPLGLDRLRSLLQSLYA